MQENYETINKRLIITLIRGKEYKDLEESIVDNAITIELAKNSKLKKKVQKELLKENTKECKELIKTIRATFRKTYAVFQTGKLTQEDYNNIKLEDIERHNLILHKHASSKERIIYYPELYPKIFAITKTPKSILDIGCGLNPFSFAYMNLDSKHTEYFASDISDEALTHIITYLTQLGVTAHKQSIDLKQIKQNPNLLQEFTHKKVDICFMFKLLDSIETKGHKLAEILIENTPSKWVVASFATTIIRNKPMNHPYRGWIELMCKRLGYTIQILEMPTELFYIIKKE